MLKKLSQHDGTNKKLGDSETELSIIQSYTQHDQEADQKLLDKARKHSTI